MPYYKKKNYTRKRRKRRYKKKSYNTGGMNRVVTFKNTSPLPVRFKCIMRYSDPFVQMTPAGSAIPVTRVYTCNGLYDPDITGVGHQPSGFDQIMPMYDHYVVIGAKISCTFFNRNNNNTIMAGLDIRDSSTPTGDFREIVESGSSKTVLLTSENTFGSSATLTYKINPNKFLSRSKPLSDPNLKGDVASNPTEQCYFHVIIAGEGGEEDTVNTSISIEYQCIFIEPKPVGLL